MMKKRIVIGMALICCMLCLPFFTKMTKAATTEVMPLTISSPGERLTCLENGEGIIFTKEKISGETRYQINLPERGWLIFCCYAEDTYNTHSPEYDLYKDASLTEEVNERGVHPVRNERTQGYYLDPGKYYFREMGGFKETFYAFFLPNSAAVSHKLVKDKDNNGYIDTVTAKPNIGATYLRSEIVAPENIWSGWEKAATNADDVYHITANGEYTVQVLFNDDEWRSFPVMYSFSVNDIGKDTKDDKTQDDKTKDDKTKDDSKTVDAKLNVTSKTIKVGETFKLKMTGTKVVSFKSSKKSVAKVSASGKVTGKKKGSATIKVTCENGETYTCKVKVKK